MFNYIIYIFIIVFLIYFNKRPYPRWIINQIKEPLIRFLLYLSVYLLSLYDYTGALLLLIAVTTLHLDYIHLIE